MKNPFSFAAFSACLRFGSLCNSFFFFSFLLASIQGLRNNSPFQKNGVIKRKCNGGIGAKKQEPG